MSYFFFLIFIILISSAISILKLPKLHVITFIITALFIGFRYDIGIDYYNYEKIFDSFNQVPYQIKYEPLYYILNIISPSYLWVNIFSSMLILLPLYFLCKKSKINPTIFITIFILSDMFFSSFNIVRQMISLSWIMFGTWYLLEKKILKFILISIIAISFHYSSIFVIILILFISKANFNLYLYFTVVLLVFIVSKFNLINNNTLTLISQFSGYEHYFNNTSPSEGSGFKFILYFFFYLILPFLFLNKYLTINKNNILYIRLVSVGLCFSFLALTISILYRFSYSFLYFYIILVSSILTNMSSDILKKKNISNLIPLVLAIYIFLFIIFYSNISNETFGVKNYNWLIYEKIFIY
ncbi:EpsG family protein [Providencia sp. wls1916]|uniref:EpsG family protein n=1 Tax=Providencia sp. wls1916 TaxID=2675155 RepID=UPI0012B54C13|nr:hypothetical protein [Providencia sp. wls1916]